MLWAGLLALAAVSASAVAVYAESGTSCGGLIQPRDPSNDAVCGELYDRRRSVVVVVAALAALLLPIAAASAATRRELGLRPKAGGDVERLRGAATLAGLAAPMAYLPIGVVTFLFAADLGVLGPVGLPSGWQHVAHAAGVVFACLVLRAFGVTRATALAAAALGVPAMLALLVGLVHVLEGPSFDGSARLSDNPFIWVAAALPVVVALLATGALQRQGRYAPGEMVSAGLILFSVGVATVVLLPQLLPVYREAEELA